jgi:hypothetical protein
MGAHNAWFEAVLAKAGICDSGCYFRKKIGHAEIMRVEKTPLFFCNFVFFALKQFLKDK